jgi:hypothetical protein
MVGYISKGLKKKGVIMPLQYPKMLPPYILIKVVKNNNGVCGHIFCFTMPLCLGF